MSKTGMELLLRLSSGLPREIASEAFFLIRPPTDDDFLKACANGKSLLIEQWLFFDLVDASMDGNYPIMLVALYGHISVVSLLLDHGADASARNNDPISMAAKYGHPEIVALLLDHGADPSTRGCEALYWAVWNGHLPVVSLLLDHGVTPSDSNIFWAERNGHSEVADLLRSKRRRIDYLSTSSS